MKKLSMLLMVAMTTIILAACGGNEEEVKGPEFLVPELEDSITKSDNTLEGIWGSHTDYVHLEDPKEVELDGGQVAYVFTYKAKNNFKESVIEITVKRGTGGKQTDYLGWISDETIIEDGSKVTSYN